MSTVTFDFTKPVAWDNAAKLNWHKRARVALHHVAFRLNLKSADYDLRSNKAGPAVSGEVILHSDKLYVCVLQTATGSSDFYARTCNGRRDYQGGANHWLPLALLNEPDRLAAKLRGIMMAAERFAAPRATPGPSTGIE